MLLVGLALALVIAFSDRAVQGNGADLPPRIVVQGFLKPERDNTVLLLRIPLVLLAGFSLPKRGPGYLDLARIDERLRQAVTAAGQQIEVFDGDRRLTPTRSEWRPRKMERASKA